MSHGLKTNISRKPAAGPRALLGKVGKYINPTISRVSPLFLPPSSLGAPALFTPLSRSGWHQWWVRRSIPRPRRPICWPSGTTMPSLFSLISRIGELFLICPYLKSLLRNSGLQAYLACCPRCQRSSSCTQASVYSFSSLLCPAGACSMVGFVRVVSRGVSDCMTPWTMGSSSYTSPPQAFLLLVRCLVPGREPSAPEGSSCSKILSHRSRHPVLVLVSNCLHRRSVADSRVFCVSILLCNVLSLCPIDSSFTAGFARSPSRYVRYTASRRQRRARATCNSVHASRRPALSDFALISPDLET